MITKEQRRAFFWQGSVEFKFPDGARFELPLKEGFQLVQKLYDDGYRVAEKDTEDK